MSVNNLTFYFTKAQEQLSFLSKLPGKYKTLDDTQKTTVLVIATTSSIFTAIGCLFGFLPFVCTTLGYFTPHLMQRYTKAETPSDQKVYYAIGAALCYILFNLGALIGYAIGAGLYTIEPITQHRINSLEDKSEPTESNFFKQLLKKDNPWIDEEGKNIEIVNRMNKIKKVGLKNTKPIENLWTQAEKAIGYGLNVKVRRADHRIHGFLQLLHPEKRKEYIKNYGWPEKIPYRGISSQVVINGICGLFTQKPKPTISTNEGKGS